MDEPDVQISNGAIALMDLVQLAEFRGTHVPRASPAGSCLQSFGPLLTHPNITSFPWSTLRSALEAYFGTTFLSDRQTPTLPPLDATRIASGWCGLQLILTAFKRVEAVPAGLETMELVCWLQAIKIAVCRRSLSLESFDPSSAGLLQSVLANLREPVAASELVNITRSRTTSLSSYTNSKPLAATSTSFERGSDATRSPPPSVPSGSLSPPSLPLHASSRARLEPIMDRINNKRNGGVVSPPEYGKRRRSNSGSIVGGLSVIPSRPSRGPRDSTVSTSALSSFADFSDHPDLDPLSDSDPSSASEGEEEHSVHSQQSRVGGLKPGKQTLQKKIQILSQRLSDVTGIPLTRCIETISRFPDEELSSINPNAPIPPQFLPPYPSSSSSSSSSSTHSGNATLPVLASPTRAKSTGGGAGSASLSLARGGSTTSVATTSSKKSTNSASTSTTAMTSANNSREGSIDSKSGAGGGTRQQKAHDPNRPGFSYSALIGQAILSTPEKRLRLAEIYDYVTSHYPYYKKNECGWQNSIRHNLSLQPVFQKVPDPSVTSGTGKKGCFWTIVPSEEWRFANGGWLKMDKLHGGAGGSGSGTPIAPASTLVRNGKKSKLSSAAASLIGVGKKRASNVMKRDPEEEEEDRLLDQLQNKLVQKGVGVAEDDFDEFENDD